jgi:hypothetical protein
MNISWTKEQKILEKAIYDASKGLYPTELVLFQDGFEDGMYWPFTAGTGVGWSAVQSAAQALQGKYSLLMSTRLAGAAPGDLVQAHAQIPTVMPIANADYIWKGALFIPMQLLANLGLLRLTLQVRTGTQQLQAHVDYDRATTRWGYPNAAWVFTPFVDTAANLTIREDTWLSVKWRFNATLARAIEANIGGIEIDISDMDIKVGANTEIPTCNLGVQITTAGAAQARAHFDNIELLNAKLW